MTALHLASMYGELETVRTLVELGVDKEAKDNVVRNLMMMMMMMMMTWNIYDDDDDDDDDIDDDMKYVWW